ncbi:MAG TPA: class I SAM-dependent methyltransferase [Devosiaceae bacterium]|jgi:SAM-dependent methyltransferase
MARHEDGSAGDANYGAIGPGYTSYRQPEPAIEALIHQALGDARTVLNVGAGAGSYEPRDREVTAVEPSESMRAQRPAHLVRAIDAVAEKLPFADKHFDAAMATFTVHQWPDLAAGLAEVIRVTRGAVLILSCDPELVQHFWLNDYAPLVLSTEARRYPSMRAIAGAFAGGADVLPVPIPLNCRDGFNEAYYGRPEMLLQDGARKANSAWSFVDAEIARGYVFHLGDDIETGVWDRKHGHLRTQPAFEGSLRLVVGRP